MNASPTGLLIAFAIAVGSSTAVAAEPTQPNVIFILVDDLGWSDVGYNGSKFYETPNVDRLAEQSMVLSDFYSAGPVCSPTRASILTGKYPARVQITRHLLAPNRDPKHMVDHLPLREFTIGEAFRKNGYSTGYFGKWHLGYENQHWASQQGFEKAKGGMDLPWAWKLCFPEMEEAPTAATWPKKHTRFFSPHHLTHLENGPEGEYLTDRLMSETIKFVEQNQEKPFFAFLSFHSVHTPLQVKPGKEQKYGRKLKQLEIASKKETNKNEKTLQNNPAYAAMIEHMDENVGRLLTRLDELKLSDNTIVVWTSDNGGKGTVTSNLPLRGMKHNLYEGGIRVPTIVRWPKQIDAGTVNDTPLISNDFYPTLLELAGCPLEFQQHIDGQSFAGLLLGKTSSIKRDAIYWHYPHSRQEAAVREGKYKLLYRFKSEEVELYDLKTDLGERRDLSKQEPEVAQRLLKKLMDWQTSVDAKFEGDEVDRTRANLDDKQHPKSTEAKHTIPLVTSSLSKKRERPNVLLIAVDDWNDWVGCLGHEQAKTPNVDRLAKRGLLFSNAHCAAPVCNPSRVALLTGLRPDTTGVYENNHVMRRKCPEVITLPQYFRQNGFHVAGGGKVFHDVPPHCDDPKSWDEYYWWNEHGPKGGRVGNSGWRSPYSIPPDPQPDVRPGNKITELTKRNFDWGVVDQPESDWPDVKVVNWATEFLQREHNKPFFLSVGIFRPHVPWFNPRRYVDLHPLENVLLPKVKADDLDDVGEWARARALDPASKHDKVVEFNEWKSAVQAYYASISFADANVGRVLDALDKSNYRENTIIVLWSDHGYHLGEKGHWHKRTLWERSTHVPFIVVAPGITIADSRCDAAVSLLDIFPTLTSLCGLKPRLELEGHDLTRVLGDPKTEWIHPAITTYRAGNHSVRTKRWRYTRYVTGEEELYDHSIDPNEWNNLAGLKSHQELKNDLMKNLSGLSQAKQ